MTIPILRTLKRSLRSANQWVSQAPERALEDAYDAALMIKAIEDEHFQGRKITSENASYSDNVMAYFEGELNKYLKLSQAKLSLFKRSRDFLGNPFINTLNKPPNEAENYHELHEQEVKDKANIILEKLNFIDEVVGKYYPPAGAPASVAMKPPASSAASNNSAYVTVYEPSVPNPKNNNNLNLSYPLADDVNAGKMSETITDKTSFLPRSILRTLDRLKRELDPKAEEEVVRDFRSSKTKTVVSMKFLLLIILIPLLTHQISKNFIVGPIVDQIREKESVEIFLNTDMEEEAFEELNRFEEKLKFKMIIGTMPQLSSEALEEKVKEKAEELAAEYRYESSSAIKNVFSDMLSFVAFFIVIFNSKREIAVLKSFMDDIVYGLSDSAKAFIIILFTDIFVGFHSPHGWEVILEGISRHLGIPENRDFIFLFIATFPVILDTVFKYWIFRYLNRISPSAVATYRNMNE